MWKKNDKDEIAQVFEDLELGKEECESMKTALEEYGISDTGAENIYTMTEDPTSQKVKQAMRSLKNRLNDNKDKKFLIVYVIVGQGLHSHGQQIVLLNQMNNLTGFYKHWSVETDIRSIAFNFPNVYQVAFFACGRELWNSIEHVGCFESKEATE